MLPASGAISLADVNTELGYLSTTKISLNDSAVRSLFGLPINTIDMNTGHGKSIGYTFNYTISSNTTNFEIKQAAINSGWDQVKKLFATITINSGIYVYSTSTGSYAFSTGSGFPTGSILKLFNNGYILGMGGNGGEGGVSAAGSSGTNGGPALYAGYSISITNNGTIAGGGGGGGGGGA